MADLSVTPNSRGRLLWFLVALALAAIAGLLVWVAIRNERIDAADAAEAAAAGPQAVELTAVAAAADDYVGRPLSVGGVTVLVSLGPRAFWADVPGRNPFLVALGPEVTDPEVAAEGQVLEILGAVHPLVEAQIDSLVRAGALNEASREEATFATHLLVATEARQ